MEFDKSKVYTALNAEELQVGSKVIVAKNLAALRLQVCESHSMSTLRAIRSEDYQDRFVTEFDSDGVTITTTLAYLVSEPEKLQWTDLKIGDIITNNAITAMVTAIFPNGSNIHIHAHEWLSDTDLSKWRKVEDENNN